MVSVEFRALKVLHTIQILRSSVLLWLSLHLLHLGDELANATLRIVVTLLLLLRRLACPSSGGLFLLLRPLELGKGVTHVVTHFSLVDAEHQSVEDRWRQVIAIDLSALMGRL